MSGWRKIWANGLPDEDRSPKSSHRMAAEGIPFPWRGNGGTISTQLDVIWGMSDEADSPPTSTFVSGVAAPDEKLWGARSP